VLSDHEAVPPWAASVTVALMEPEATLVPRAVVRATGRTEVIDREPIEPEVRVALRPAVLVVVPAKAGVVAPRTVSVARGMR
jgi:hypothetical protein